MPTLPEFCWKMVWQIINNIYIREREEGGEFFPESINFLITAPIQARRYHNRRLICTGKMPIKTTTAALNAEKYKYLLYMHPRSVDMQ